MTLIVALKSVNGVVMASDSQATIATQIQTRAQTQKLYCLGERIVWGSAGSVGLTQRVKEALDEKLGKDKKKCGQPLSVLRPEIRRIVTKVQKEAQDAFVPSGQARTHVGNAFLFAGHTGGSPWIYEIADTGSDVEHDPHSAIGSGDVFAYFAQASMAHLPLQNADEDVAKMIVYRTIDTACRVSAFGISMPLHMWHATATGCGELALSEVDAVRDAVNLWQQLEADLLPTVLGGGSSSNPA